ncbi:MAG: threonylcarbamoyl-AMP synthase [Anaerolineaceae bacterium]|nr:threonylcarbamoyl-AMP synthase [Anaerolineaceae bacterium]
METRVIEQSNPQSFNIAEEVLRAGGVIAIPTDTVYGIACLVNKRDSILSLYAIKEREHIKAIPILIGKLEQTVNISTNFSSAATILSQHFWPGALTLVINKHPDLLSEISIYPTVGIRMPDHDWLRSLMQSCGPLAVTSANISGQPNLSTAQDVLEALNGRIDLLIDGGTCTGGIPSTVIDCTLSPVKVLRVGSIPELAIHRVIEESYSNSIGEKTR